MSLSLQAILKVAGKFTSSLDLTEVDQVLNYSATENFATGTGANQANQVFTDTRTLSASSNEDLDLAGGLTDAFGTTITFTKIKAILIKAASGNTNDVQVTRAASNGVPLFMAAGDGIALTPGAAFSAIFPDANGVTVTASTGDLLNIANSSGGTSVSYDIVIVGTV